MEQRDVGLMAILLDIQDEIMQTVYNEQADKFLESDLNYGIIDVCILQS